eukprot:3486453-Prymnesium_polylepis.1
MVCNKYNGCPASLVGRLTSTHDGRAAPPRERDRGGPTSETKTTIHAQTAESAQSILVGVGSGTPPRRPQRPQPAGLRVDLDLHAGAVEHLGVGHALRLALDGLDEGLVARVALAQ